MSREKIDGRESIDESDVIAAFVDESNPFNPSAVIGYDVPKGDGRVKLCIYNVSGQLAFSTAVFHRRFNKK